MHFRFFLATLCFASAVFSATPAKKVTPSAPSSPATRAMTPKEIEARREMLSRVIAAQQRVMDAYERQTMVKKGLGLSEAQYLAAKKARDAAQAERDSLANRS